MFDFCPHCGETISGQPQIEGQAVSCRSCGKEIGVVKIPKKKIIDRTEEAIQSGSAARCPDCGQTVEVKNSGGVPSFVPHFVAFGPRIMCAKSGKPTAATTAASSPPPQRAAAGKDLSAYYTRENIKVVACRSDGEPTIELLHLEFLDKSDRIRLQIDAIRDILGTSFQMKAYPPETNRSGFLLWGNTSMCVIAKKHEQGGYQTMSDAEISHAIGDLRNAKARFFE